MSLETGVAISTPDSCGVLARNLIRLPFDGGCKDRPARRKIYIAALSDAATLARIQNVELFCTQEKPINLNMIQTMFRPTACRRVLLN